MTSHFNAIGPRAGRIGALAAVIAALACAPALAQGWWPWETQPRRAPAPQEPVYRPPAQPQPPAGMQPAPFAQGSRSAICLQLEQRLAQEANRGSQTRDALPKLEAEIRQVDRQIQSGQSQLDRSDCFEYFLFSKSLKRTRTCVDLNNQVETARRRLSELEGQRQQIMGTSGRSYQDEIIRELARNSCGAGYQREAARQSPFSSIWQDEEGAGLDGGRFGQLPFATYRTLCVRLCDGYYFPVSFSTLPNHFERDEDACKSRCAAPAELYYHQNPGGSAEQMVSARTRQPYTGLNTAFRYRKEFVQGCSCKQADYVPAQADRRADAAPPAPKATPFPRR